MHKRYKRNGKAIKYEETRFYWEHFFKQFEKDKEFKRGQIMAKKYFEEKLWMTSVIQEPSRHEIGH